MNIKILWFLLLIFITSICVGSDDSKIEYTNPEKTIVVERSKPTFSVIVQANPTTGYSWLLRSYDSNLIAPVSHKFYPPTDKKLVGAPGYEKWTFRVKSLGFIVPQATSITLIYAHLWDGQAVNSINFKVVTNNAN
jgi:inhibitor of cysteine peptidase